VFHKPEQSKNLVLDVKMGFFLGLSEHPAWTVLFIHPQNHN